VQKIAIILQFYSGLNKVTDTGHWEHYGSPAYYNFIRKLNLDEELDYQIFFLSTKLSKKNISGEVSIDNLKRSIVIVPYYFFIDERYFFHSKKVNFIYNKIRQYFFIIKKCKSVRFYYTDRDNLLFASIVLLLTNKKTLTRLLGVTKSLYDHLTVKNNIYSKMIKWVFRNKNSYFICSNDGSYAELTDKLVNDNRFFLLFNGVNKNTHNLYKSKKSSEKIRVVYISRIEENKGHYDFIKFIKNFNLKENLEVIFIGDGSLKKEYSKLVNQLKLENIIHFYGRIKHESVTSQLKKSDLFLSLNYDGSFGNGVLEAAQLSLPIVTLLHPGCLTEEVYSFKVIKNNKNLYKELLSFFTDFISSPELRKAMSANSYNFSKKNLISWEDRIDKELYFIKENII